MVAKSAVEARFSKRVKQERERRKWSQADLATRLKFKGLKGIYPTTIAKIESGERAVRVDEAAALADLFEVSLDALLGLKHNSHEDELGYLLRVLRDTARLATQQVGATIESIRAQLDELPGDFDGAEELQQVGQNTWSTHLLGALKALIELDGTAGHLMDRRQRTSELAGQETVRSEAHDDEAQS